LFQKVIRPFGKGKELRGGASSEKKPRKGHVLVYRRTKEGWRSAWVVKSQRKEKRKKNLPLMGKTEIGGEEKF